MFEVINRQDEILDINPGGSPLTLLDALYQSNTAYAGIQLREDFNALGVAAVEALLYVFEGEENIHPVVFVNPVVSHRQAHTVEHQAVQDFSVA